MPFYILYIPHNTIYYDVEEMQMERYNSRVIDEMGKVVLPGDIRHKLSLNERDRLQLTSIATVVIAIKTKDEPVADSPICVLDDLGRIELPRCIRQKHGWQTKSKLAVYNTDDVIILKLDERLT